MRYIGFMKGVKQELIRAAVDESLQSNNELKRVHDYRELILEVNKVDKS